MSVHYWLVLHPDLSKPIGGVKQMHRLAEAISACGRKSTIIQDDASFHPSWFSSSVETISYSQWLSLRQNHCLSANDVIIFPETYITAAKDYSGGLSSVIFNQNSSYTFGLDHRKQPVDAAIMRELYGQEFIKHVFCVSQYDHHFLSSYICKNDESVSCIVNGLEESLFMPFSAKLKQIIYMPRKNYFDASVVSSMMQSSNLLSDWTLIPINGIPHEDVVSYMRSSLLFLSFGHPEGFGLPVAEALASGCAVVGYSGLGGRELFDLASQYRMAEEISLGDWSSFIKAVQDFQLSYELYPVSVINSLTSVSRDIQSKYNFQAMIGSVLHALQKVEAKL